MNVFEIIINDQEKVTPEDVFHGADNKAALTQIIKEHKYLDVLEKYKLPVSNKILLYGDSGCGKTTTAKAIANALGKKIVIVDLSTLVNSRIGETSRNIKGLFDKAARDKAVLFLDEFDQIGKMRSSEDKEVGEMRRLVNAIIQQIDYLPQHAILICATNHYDLIDIALIRRFQLRLKFELPDEAKLDEYYDKLLSTFPFHLQNVERKYDLSYAEVKDYIHTEVKKRIILELDEAN
jgi:SpoVK/Ycf46/Vps4 family AAA+-type ATPase